MSENIKVEHSKGILCLTLARVEKKNALTGAMYAALTQAIRAAATDGTRAIVIAGGEGIFCAGNDIADFLRAGAEQGFDGMPALDFIRLLATNTIPLIAAIDGPAIGIGTTLILHCDLVYASPRALFRMPFVDLGLVPEAGSSLLVPMRVGMAKATEFLMLGEAFDAADALRLGLVNAIVAPEALLAHAMAQAKKLAVKPAHSLVATRRLMRGDSAALLARIEEEIAVFAAGMKTPQARQMFEAFLARSKG